MLAQRSYPNLAMAILMVLIATFSTTYVSRASPQTCTVTLPTGTWTGQTQNGVGGIYESNTNVSIASVGSNSFTLSDFSSGLIGHFGFSNNNPATIEIDCNNEVLSQSFSIDYGTCNITGGTWSPTTQTLTINWSVPENHINEISVYNLN